MNVRYVLCLGCLIWWGSGELKSVHAQSSGRFSSAELSRRLLVLQSVRWEGKQGQLGSANMDAVGVRDSERVRWKALLLQAQRAIGEAKKMQRRGYRAGAVRAFRIADAVLLLTERTAAQLRASIRLRMATSDLVEVRSQLHDVRVQLGLVSREDFSK